MPVTEITRILDARDWRWYERSDECEPTHEVTNESADIIFARPRLRWLIGSACALFIGVLAGAGAPRPVWLIVDCAIACVGGAVAYAIIWWVRRDAVTE